MPDSSRRQSERTPCLRRYTCCISTCKMRSATLSEKRLDPALRRRHGRSSSATDLTLVFSLYRDASAISRPPADQYVPTTLVSPLSSRLDRVRDLTKKCVASPVCSEVMKALQECHAQYPYLKFVAACNDLKHALNLCLREEVSLSLALGSSRSLGLCALTETRDDTATTKDTEESGSGKGEAKARAGKVERDRRRLLNHWPPSSRSTTSRAFRSCLLSADYRWCVLSTLCFASPPWEMTAIRRLIRPGNVRRIGPNLYTLDCIPPPQQRISSLPVPSSVTAPRVSPLESQDSNAFRTDGRTATRG